MSSLSRQARYAQQDLDATCMNSFMHRHVSNKPLRREKYVLNLNAKHDSTRVEMGAYHKAHVREVVHPGTDVTRHLDETLRLQLAPHKLALEVPRERPKVHELKNNQVRLVLCHNPNQRDCGKRWRVW